MVGVSIDITEREQAEKQRLNAELDRRIKSALATVCAIIFQTQNGNATFEGFVASIARHTSRPWLTSC